MGVGGGTRVPSPRNSKCNGPEVGQSSGYMEPVGMEMGLGFKYKRQYGEVTVVVRVVITALC